MNNWTEILQILDFAFQPIVNAHTGSTFGFEALLRNVTTAGFSSIDEVFGAAFEDHTLVGLETALRLKAITKFVNSNFHLQSHLFLNIDNRALGIAGSCQPALWDLLEKFQLKHRICFEISEKQQINFEGTSIETMRTLRHNGISLAIDDYGTGFSGLQLLYYTDPAFIKVDRFFIQDISTDLKKKNFVNNLVQSAHQMGSLVVAEGVETIQEYYECLELGCDLIQGYLVERPQTDMTKLALHYQVIATLSQQNFRHRHTDRSLTQSRIENISPVRIDSNIFDVFFLFQHNNLSFIPVVNLFGEPIGIVRECQFKRYAYSRFGRELLQNASAKQSLMQFVDAMPIIDCSTPAEKILEVYSLSNGADCLLVTEQMRYIGVLSAHSLLSILHEKNITIARDQNPLTRLPGNNIIFEFVSQCLSEMNELFHLVYLDIDNFKPFNDRYGFRQGDRVILLVAELLKEISGANLIAHIGGDDFFVAFKNFELPYVLELVSKALQAFTQNVKPFYDSEDRTQGYILAKARGSEDLQRFPLLTCSASIVELEPGRDRIAQDTFSKVIADGKRIAKNDASHCCV